MACDSINILSLCSGIGGLDRAVGLATSGRARTVCYVEREAFCAAILASRMADKGMDAAPVWSDLRSFDGRPWRGIVDCVIGGYPCQPFSFAGKRGGECDPRHLWPDIARIVAEVQPGVVFFENVAGHLTMGFPAVRRELEGMGYRVTAGLFTAAEVGAPHRRERLFILGVADSAERGCGELRTASRSNGQPQQDGGTVANAQRAGTWQGEQGEQREPRQRWCGLADDGVRLENTNRQHDRLAPSGWSGPSRGFAAGSSEQVADTGRERPQGQFETWPATGTTGRSDGALADTADTGRRQDSRTGPIGRNDASRTSGRDAFGVFPPGPGDIDAWRRIIAARPDLAPATEPGVRGVADGSAGRLDRLRALRNGVVPQCGANAFVTLWACFQEDA